MSKERIIGEVSDKKKECYYFEWKIPKFSSLSNVDNFYESPSFTLLNISSHLKVELPDIHYDHVTVSLVSEDMYLRCVALSFSIKKYDGTLIGTKTVFRGGAYCADFEFLNRSILQREEIKYLPEGSLTIICHFTFNLDGKQTLLPAEEVNTLTDISEHMRLTELNTLSDNLKSLFINKDSCDVILRVQEKDFNAHKVILKARSSVFASTFNHDTLENQTGIINIPDCDADSFLYFLEFLYCGKLEDIAFQNALHLYIISDKYNVQELKGYCVEYMKRYLTENNVCDVIILADMYEESSLLTVAQDFFSNNAGKVMETTQWENLLKDNYRLGNKVMKGVVSKLTNVGNQSSK